MDNHGALVNFWRAALQALHLPNNVLWHVIKLFYVREWKRKQLDDLLHSDEVFNSLTSVQGFFTHFQVAFCFEVSWSL